VNLLFIGGTGNISTDCAEVLHKAGHSIILLTRGNSPVPAGYRALKADRKDPNAMRKALEEVQVDVVLNFLGYELTEAQADFELFWGRISQYIFISSATVYAKPPPRLPITEDCPLGNPWWDYAQKKHACEDWLMSCWDKEMFPLTIVRPSHTYSKRWIPNHLSSSSYSFAARLEQGLPVFVPDHGENPWTLTAASDFALGLAGLVGNPQAIGERFHITSDEALSWNQICLEIAEALGAPRPTLVPVPTDFICQVAPVMTGGLKGDKAHPGVFDNSKLKRVVPGFQCRKPFRVGVRESVAWLRANPKYQCLNPQIDATVDSVLAAWQEHSAYRGAP
jgi:nucleoside-diphosphate-sugar epimerase